MKKTISLILVVLMMLALLAACGQAGDGSEPAAPDAATGTAAIESLGTIGDAMALDSAEMREYATYNNHFIYVFELDGTSYRVIASVTDEQEQAIFDLDYEDPDHDAKQEEIVGPLKIETYENLSDMILPQEELDQWVGKTGQELMDAGWTNSGWNLDDMEFWMDYGPMMYSVIMEGTVENVEEFEEEDIGPLVIKSVTWQGLGDATDIGEDE